ncbi:type II CAAX endopeptidase family protein [Dubosiella newyorkensis]|uniref:type II CAAX endopeptidase family protein n=1 Tax=Dubosiella newyorkensis TaxID=1862672 RepID=UPI0025838462|nr:type II CAAX endopeptidase family protein [Dubosiella newyorkensis]
MNKPPVFTAYTSLRSKIDRAGQSLWIYLLVQLCASLIGSLGLGFLLAWLPMHLQLSIEPVLSSLILLLSSILSGLCAILFFKSRYPLLWKEDLKRPFKASDVWNGYALLSLASFAFSLIFSLVNQWLNAPIQQPDFGVSRSLFSDLILFVAIVLVGPAIEELFFRGVLLKSFEAYGKTFSIVFSALCFGMMHLNFAQGLPAFFMGCVLGCFYAKTRSLTLVILIHMLNNAISFLTMSTWFMWIAPFVILLACLYGIVYLILKRKEFTLERRRWSSPKEVYQLAFKNVWILVFGFVFILSSLWMWLGR